MFLSGIDIFPRVREGWCPVIMPEMKSPIQHILIGSALVLLPSVHGGEQTDTPSVSKDLPPIASGRFQPTDESLKQYRYPEWFRDAKLGFWSHWGPQAVPRQGDWYARKLYIADRVDKKRVNTAVRTATIRITLTATDTLPRRDTRISSLSGKR
jgi:hypothetical protein